MTKRDIINIVFRIMAILIIVTTIKDVIMTVLYYGDIQDGLSIVSLVFAFSLPLGCGYLLWDRSTWLTDTILSRYHRDQEAHTDDLADEPVRITPVADEEFRFYLSRLDIMTLAFTILGMYLLATCAPELVMAIFWLVRHRTANIVFADDPSVDTMDIGSIVGTTVQLAFGLWLVQRAPYFADSLDKIHREHLDKLGYVIEPKQEERPNET